MVDGKPRVLAGDDALGTSLHRDVEHLLTVAQDDTRRAEIATAAERLFGHDLTFLGQDRARELEQLIHTLWNQEMRENGARLLETLWRAHTLSDLGILRIVERGKDKELRAKAADYLAPKESLNHHFHRILSHYFEVTGDPARELIALEKYWSLQKDDFNCVFAFAKALARQGKADRLQQVLQEAKDWLRPKQTLFIKYALAVEHGHGAQGYKHLIEFARIHRDVPLHATIRLCHILASEHDVERRDVAVTLLRAFHPGRAEVRVLEIHQAIRERDLPRARALFDEHTASLTDIPLNIQLLELDLLGHEGRLEEAAAIARKLVSSDSPPLQVFRSCVRALSEAGHHSEVVDVGLRFIDAETSNDILSIVLRASRKAGRTPELFQLIYDKCENLNPVQSSFFESMVEDLLEHGWGDAEHLRSLVKDPERLARIRSKCFAPHVRTAALDTACVYFCADAAYLIPSLISLTSAALTNEGMARSTPFAIVANPDETLARAQAYASKLQQRLGMDVSVFDAGSMVNNINELDPRYGFFTAGQSLSLAAFYRIFFAKYLMEQKQFDTAIYIDADTVVHRGLGELVSIDMKQPLLARPEVDRPEVVYAQKFHNLSGAYFNSGVLRFDLRSADMPGSIEKAVMLSTDPDATLLFQDQCALNIAFDGKYEHLDPKYNTYWAPSRTVVEDEAASEKVIQHYIDRPKPWDSLYRRDASTWFHWYDVVRNIVDFEQGH